jgi:hypothetical protein
MPDGSPAPLRGKEFALDNTTTELADINECIFCESRFLDGDHKIIHMCDACAKNPTLALGERMKKAEAAGGVDATISKICDSLPLVCPLCMTVLDPDDVGLTIDAPGETDDEIIARLKKHCPQCKEKP